MTTDIAIRSGSTPNLDAVFQAESWLSINPSMHIGNTEVIKTQGTIAIDKDAGDALERLIIHEGYFHIPQLPWNLPLDEMAKAIVRVSERGFVPPFCFVYDEFWLLLMKLNQVLSRLLGEGYMMLPDFWAWYVDPRVGQSGWRPHRDRDYTSLFPDRRPKSLSVWIPLTEATTLNGCMYLVPANSDPTYGTPQDKDWQFQPQDIRALPGPAGGLFVWTQAVVHWGSRSSPRAAGPRISLSVEFQRGDIPPFDNPLIPPLAPLTLDYRLRLIAKQMFQYAHMYTYTPEQKQLADDIRVRTSANA